MKWLGYLALLMICAEGGVAADPLAGDLEVEVTQLPADGVLFLELFQVHELEQWGGEPTRRTQLPASQAQMRWEVEALPFGNYAIRVFLDENGNGVLDKTAKGIPKEAFGFSNNAMGKRGIPRPLKAAFVFDAEHPMTSIQLRSRKRKAEPPASEVERANKDEVE